MATLDGWTLGPLAAAASGVLFALLGATLLALSGGRVHRVAFGAFSLLWGFQVVTGNVSRLLAPDPAARVWSLLLVASLLVLYVPLVYFVSLYPGERTFFARSVPAGLLLMAPAALGAVAFLARPSLFHDGFDPATGADAWGPAIPLFAALYFGAFDYALFVLYRRRQAATNVTERRRLLLLLAAFGVYVAYVSGETLLLYGIPLVSGDTPSSALPVAGTFIALALVGAGLVAIVARGLLRRSASAERRGILAALALPSLFGLISGASGAAFDTVGVWRVVSVALIAYAILRYELFDIDVRVKRGALVAGILVAACAAALVLEQGLERVLGSTGVAITLTQFALVGAIAAVVLKAPTAARSLGERILPSLQSPATLDARRLEVYEAALAQAAASGGLDANAAFLADLRARLGVTDPEHALLARLAAAAPPRAAQEIAEGALVAGRYRIESLLGEGSMGAAWLARDETLERRVVVKALHKRLGRSERASRAFLREARVAASLDHPHVVKVHDFGYAGDAPFIVMEHVDGGSLEARLDREGALAPREAERVIREVLLGLAHVHERGLLHRDLKAGNVLLTRAGAAKLADFGIAAGPDADETSVGLDAPGPRGTPATMSPEAVRGLPQLEASDVYSAGAVLYLALTGRPYLALEGLSRAQMHHAIVEDAPRDAPPGTDARLLAVARRALAKSPRERYASAGEMLEALAPAVTA